MVELVYYGPVLDAEPTDVSYVHHQNTPASTWTINHGLGFRPAGVQVVDSGGADWEGNVDHVDENTMTISFETAGVPASFGGTAYLS